MTVSDGLDEAGICRSGNSALLSLARIGSSETHTHTHTHTHTLREGRENEKGKGRGWERKEEGRHPAESNRTNNKNPRVDVSSAQFGRSLIRPPSELSVLIGPSSQMETGIDSLDSFLFIYPSPGVSVCQCVRGRGQGWLYLLRLLLFFLLYLFII